MLNKFVIKHKLNSFFIEKKIHNSKFELPKILKIEFFNYGYNVYLDISKRCSLEDITNNLSYLKSFFRLVDINLLVHYKGGIVLEFITIEIDKKKFSNLKLSPYEILAGYDSKGELIKLDMKKCPHLAIQGLSGTGKTVFAEYVANNLLYSGSNVVILNSFDDDFLSLKNVKRINGIDEIQDYLNLILTSKFKYRKPFYILIDEINILSRNKQIDKLIENLLEIGRHYNVFIIAIGQILLKENIKYKQLFNSRISFKHLDKNLYSSFLNVKENLISDLENQEFYMFSDTLQKCFCFEFLAP